MLRHSRFGAVSLCCGLLLLTCFSTPARAWFNDGHMVVAQIAYNHLSPQARAQCDALIAVQLPRRNSLSTSFVTAASWADDFKGQLGTSNWHFINLPLSVDGTSTATAQTSFENASFDVVRAIRANVASLQDPAASAASRATSLRYLIHFVGDVHQPLHCVAGVWATHPDGDAGGNSVPLKGTYTNLHALWDAGAGSFDIGLSRPLTAPDQATLDGLVSSIETQYPFVDHHGTIPDPQDWAQAGRTLCASTVYPDVIENTTPTLQYKNAVQATCRQQLALAGHRLADVLNTILGPGGVGVIPNTPTPSTIANYIIGKSTDSANLNLNNDAAINAADVVYGVNHQLPGSPAPSFPANNSTTQSLTLTLQWQATPQATSYDLWYWRSTFDQPAAPTISGLTVPHFKPAAAFQALTNYKWQLRARNANGPTDGPVWMFKTGH